MRRTICVGDIHGCLEEFDLLMKSVEYKQGKDRLVLLGDLIDRGPDPAGVIRRAREIGAESVMGNHEEKALRWRKHEKRRNEDPRYKNPMAQVHVDRLAQWSKASDDDWDWVAKLPHYIHIDNYWTAVHGGCIPDVAIEDQVPNELMRMRYVRKDDKTGAWKMASLNESGEAASDSVHWTEHWRGPRGIIYGHYTRDVIWVKQSSIGIDTACVHGGHLTAAIIDSTFVPHLSSFVSVKAKQVYVPRGPWNE